MQANQNPFKTRKGYVVPGKLPSTIWHKPYKGREIFLQHNYILTPRMVAGWWTHGWTYSQCLGVVARTVAYRGTTGKGGWAALKRQDNGRAKDAREELLGKEELCLQLSGSLTPLAWALLQASKSNLLQACFLNASLHKKKKKSTAE